MLKPLHLYLFFLLLKVNCLEICPNNCSGQGKCNFDRQCECNPGYDVVADCSQSEFYFINFLFFE